jgi:hypothetical protein
MALSTLLSKLPYKVLGLWLLILLLGYYFSLPASMSKEETLLHPSGPVAYHTQAALLQRKTKEYYPQAIVFIIMGDLSRESLVEDALLSVRLLGHWEEKIIILTDRKDCFSGSQYTNMAWTVIEVPSKPNIIEIKAMKSEIFQYLPDDVHRVLYMDVDILVTRHLSLFLQDLSHILYYRLSPYISQASTNDSIPLKLNDSTMFSMAAFLDAKGHYVGFCTDCEKWHTGVIYMVRGLGTDCLAAWAKVLRSGRYGTDQESLDYVEAKGNCSHMVALPSRHLLFAKDYIGMIFTSGQTFIHLTAANRMDSQDFFYRDYVIPRIRNSLHPPLKPFIEPTQKTC